ncbi:hypothetical protein VYU27_005366 [Nannochloropsis oceanica]
MSSTDQVSPPLHVPISVSVPGNDTASTLPAFRKKPIVLLFMGMAGSGKTTLVQRLNLHLNANGTKSYYVNLDPAVKSVPFAANIDIRDTVNYKEVMNQYELGPNGAIMTSLNLFATRFDQVLTILEKRAPELEYVLVDTPGQIEVFTWSASGAIITEALATSFPTILIYIVDTPRTASPTTFMSNMLYACSILYKTRLPIVLTFNKIDILSHAFAQEWMGDFEKFQEGLDRQGDDMGYSSTLIRSMSLVLDEFYKTLRNVGVSAASGEGVSDFFEAVDEAAREFEREYLPDLVERKEKREGEQEEMKNREMERLMKDLKVEGGGGGGRGGGGEERGGGDRGRRGGGEGKEGSR